MLSSGSSGGRALSSLASLVLAGVACANVEERPHTEYLDAASTPRTFDVDAAAGGPSPDAGPSATPSGQDAGAPALGDAATQAERGVPYRSGTRLRAMVLRIEGGPTRIAGWFDSTLGAQCIFGADGAGGTSCLPTSAASRYFHDAACQAPVWARSRPGCPTKQPLFVWETGAPDACGGGAPISVRRLTPSTLDPATPLYQRVGEGCSAVTHLINPELFDAGEPLPWSTFVRMGERKQLGGIPDHVSIVTDDGAAIPSGLVDAHGASCQLLTSNDKSYCLPTPYDFLPEGNSRVYADSICTSTALLAAPSCAGKAPAPPALLLRREDCGYAAFRASAAQTGGFALAAGTCQALMSGDPERAIQLYTPAEPVPLEQLTRAERVLDGSGRFQVFTHRDDHHRTVFVEQLYRDTLLQANCRLSPLPGRGYYCPPESATTRYADAACTRPLLSVRRGCSEPGEAFSVASEASDASQECGAIARVVRRGPSYDAKGPLFSKQPKGDCMPASGVSGADDALYEYGPDVPPEQIGVFPIVTE